MTAEHPAERRSILKTAVGIYLLGLTFLLPLKFGGIAAMPEATAYFPTTFFELLIVTWSPLTLSIAGGLALLLALIAFPRQLAAYRNPAWRTMILWSIGVPLLALPGMVRATTWDFAIMELNHLAGVGAYAAAMYLFLADDPRRKIPVLYTLTAGTLLLGFFGLEQYFFGFARSRQYLKELEASGAAVSIALRARMLDTRVFATFTSCNSLAGYLLLLLPPLLAVLWRWGERFEPVKVSRAVFLLIGGLAVLAVLLMTKSRAAYLTLLILAGLIALFWPLRRRFKIVVVVCLIVGVLGGAWYIREHGRGFESMAARADYLRSSAILLGQHPVLGVGWGEFFHEHMRIKAVKSDEAAHDPHNMIMTVAQAGTGLVLVFSLALLYPLYLLLKKAYLGWHREKKLYYLELSGALGLIGFYLHSMMDTNIQVPASMAAMVALMVVLLTDEEAVPAASIPLPQRFAWAVPLALLAVFAVFSGRQLLTSEIAYDRLVMLCQQRPTPGRESAQVTPDAVRRALAEAVKLRPYSPFPWTATGAYMMSIGNYAEAETLTEEALKRAPKRSNLYFRKFQIYMLTGRRSEAVAALAKAQELFPNNPKYGDEEALESLKQLELRSKPRTSMPFAPGS